MSLIIANGVPGKNKLIIGEIALSESVEQIKVVQWFRLQYPRHVIYANQGGALLGGKNKFGLIAKMKKEGWIAGVSDLFVPVPTMIYSGLFLEMKDKGKTWSFVSEEQREFIVKMKSAGYAATWAAGFDKAKTIIEGYMKGEVV
jgi:hypothetical protein